MSVLKMSFELHKTAQKCNFKFERLKDVLWTFNERLKGNLLYII